ncbi:MAG: response regulator transcription factor [Leptolyngbyaceae cyanobacterium MO_188.B28]|nr:response regulator transcription factor [Leptolyngbyaceae cyanobacterium MO_188.B28]
MPLTILVADDDEGTRLSINDYLELAGYSVIVAKNGVEALRLIEESQPHLIITDITMPQMDGYKLIKAVRQKPALRLLPVIFLTERTQVQERIRGYRLGCDVYLPKPFELDELEAVVRNLLERSHMLSIAQVQQSDSPGSKSEALTIDSSLEPFQTPDLTAREQDVLIFISDGLSNAQIGERLFLSPRTVEKYVTSLLRKTETNNRAELVRFAIDHNLVT